MKTSDFLTACDQAVSAAVNSVGAGILLVLFVGCTIRALGRTNAATRHALWFGTMVLLFVMVPAQWWRARSATGSRALDISSPGDNVDRQASSSSRPDDAPVKSQEPADFEVHSELWPRSTSEIDDATPAPALSCAEELTTASPWSVSRLFSVRSWDLSLRPAVPQMASIILALVWATVAGAKLSLLGWRIIGMRKLKETSLPASAELHDLFVRLRAKLGVVRNAELRVSSAHRSALVLGFLRPVVLFPAQDEGNPGDAEPVLAHELAHIHRADDWVNLVQRLVEATLFFHPAVWWISKRLTLEREIASDDFVLAARRASAGLRPPPHPFRRPQTPSPADAGVQRFSRQKATPTKDNYDTESAPQHLAAPGESQAGSHRPGHSTGRDPDPLQRT